jgi:hypothetical protein
MAPKGKANKTQAEKDKAKEYNPFEKTPANTIVEVFGFKGDRIIKKTMHFSEFLNLSKTTGWRFQAFEPGFCSIKPTE